MDTPAVDWEHNILVAWQGMLQELTGVSDIHVRVRTDAGRMRVDLTSGVLQIYGDVSTSFRPNDKYEDLLREFTPSFVEKILAHYTEEDARG